MNKQMHLSPGTCSSIHQLGLEQVPCIKYPFQERTTDFCSDSVSFALQSSIGTYELIGEINQ